MSAVLVMPAACVCAASVPTVQRRIFFLRPGSLIHDRCRGRSGVGPLQQRGLYLVDQPIERKITIVAPWAASAVKRSPSGTGVRPSIRVMMTVWLTPGSVYSAFTPPPHVESRLLQITPYEKKPVQPRMFRTAYQDSSVITILTMT